MFEELIGMSDSRWRQAWFDPKRAERALRTADGTRYGVSPHALIPPRSNSSMKRNLAVCRCPYTSRSRLRSRNFSMTTSARSSRSYKTCNAWHPDHLADSFREVLLATTNSAAPIYAHGNFLKNWDADLDLPAHATVVYCPRTHAAFGHPSHPFRDFMARGVRVALGTDSLASNPDLSVLAEVRFIRSRHPDVAGDVLLRLATLNGAEAFCWADETGGLELGKSADLAVVALRNGMRQTRMTCSSRVRPSGPRRHGSAAEAWG